MIPFILLGVSLTIYYYVDIRIRCDSLFWVPISFVILFEYLKNIVLDEKRVIKILENFIESVRNRQQYEFIYSFWLKTAKDMFELDFENFESTSKSYYRKISIKALDSLSHLFERSGNFMNAILVNRYLLN